MKVIALTLGSLLALTPLVAHAESTLAASDAPSASVEPPKPQREWYGWQTLLVDGAAVTAFFATEQNNNSVGGELSAAGYVLAAPVIHLAHRNAEAAGISIALRLGLPLAGGLIGYAASRSDAKNEDSGLEAMAAVGLGAFLGVAIASIVDASVLAYVDHPTTPTSSKPDRKAFQIAPSVGPLRGGLSAGLTGTF
jgi:hypothetical protein